MFLRTFGSRRPPTERSMKKLRAMVGNKARVEGCIAEQIKHNEVAHFTSCYFTKEHNVFA
jgi:hypothetical protein